MGAAGRALAPLPAKPRTARFPSSLTFPPSTLTVMRAYNSALPLSASSLQILAHSHIEGGLTGVEWQMTRVDSLPSPRPTESQKQKHRRQWTGVAS